MRIAIADDSHPTRLMLRRIIRDAGHQCIGEVGNGKEMLELCRKLRPDLAIIDRTMPGMGGDLVARQIYDENLAKHIMMITLDAQASVFIPLIALGIRVLGKPLTAPQITAAIAAFPVPPPTM